MTWFMRQRQDFIRAQLETFGMIRRADIADRFEVSIQVASADIQTFIAAHPDAIDYDRTVKCYVYDSAAALTAPPIAIHGETTDADRVARFLAEIHARTPQGQWISVQHHPDGDWSVAEHPDASASHGETFPREAVAEAAKFMRHDGLCARIGGYGYCSCGMEKASDAIAALLQERQS